MTTAPSIAAGPKAEIGDALYLKRLARLADVARVMRDLHRLSYYTSEGTFLTEADVIGEVTPAGHPYCFQYCFYLAQARDSFLRDGIGHLSFGTTLPDSWKGEDILFDGARKGDRLGAAVWEAIARHGLRAEWDGQEGQAITVYLDR